MRIEPAVRAERKLCAFGAVLLVFYPGAVLAADSAAASPTLFGIPVEFILFAATLIGIAIFHHQTLRVALAGLAVIVIYKFAVVGFKQGPGLGGFIAHLQDEWVILVNLFLLLIGFALLSRHFDKSRLAEILPRLLPHDWKGGFWLLVIVFVLSSFLDNIAAAMIGGAMASTLFQGKVRVGYLAAIVAASNAGGAGSVVGDTTTTMMWLDGISPFDVLRGYIPAALALLLVGIPAAIAQQRYSPILKREHQHMRLDWSRIGIVAFILASAILANVAVNVRAPELAGRIPCIGLAVAAAILLSAPVRRPDWEVMPESIKGSIFLLSLVFAATLMPVERLPQASWQTALGLGYVSAVFDNIPLTALALKQGGYDWGFLAYAVGFGGSMMWFGSSAGIALSNMFPESKSVVLWVKQGWYIIVAYPIAFAVLLWTLGWQPNPPHKAAQFNTSIPVALFKR